MLLSQPKLGKERKALSVPVPVRKELSIPVRKVTNGNRIYIRRGMHVTLNGTLVVIKLFNGSLWTSVDGYCFKGWGVDETIKLVREENGYTIRFCDWILEFECSNEADEEIIHTFHAALVDSVKLKTNRMTKLLNEPDEVVSSSSSEYEDEDSD